MISCSLGLISSFEKIQNCQPSVSHSDCILEFCSSVKLQRVETGQDGSGWQQGEGGVFVARICVPTQWISGVQRAGMGSFSFFIFSPFRATCAAYGDSQARG